MEARERLLVIRILKKINRNPEYTRALGIHNVSFMKKPKSNPDKR